MVRPKADIITGFAHLLATLMLICFTVTAQPVFGNPVTNDAAAQLYCDGKKVIGKNASISLPQLGVYGIDAKVDTGARTSSLHCSHIVLNATSTWVEFNPVNSQKRFRLPVTRVAKVKSSNGNGEARPFVMLRVIIAGSTYETEFSLTERSDMKFPILLGRKLLRGHFVVDVAR